MRGRRESCRREQISQAPYIVRAPSLETPRRSCFLYAFYPPFRPLLPRYLLLLGCYQGDVYITRLALPTERSHLVYQEDRHTDESYIPRYLNHFKCRILPNVTSVVSIYFYIVYLRCYFVATHTHTHKTRISRRKLIIHYILFTYTHHGYLLIEINANRKSKVKT